MTAAAARIRTLTLTVAVTLGLSLNLGSTLPDKPRSIVVLEIRSTWS